MTGALMRIKPGGLRELHWHPNADEWQYYIKGRARMTVFGSHGRARTEEFGAGDVGYVPQGYGHYIENIGSEDVELVLALNNGSYEFDLDHRLDGGDAGPGARHQLRRAREDVRRLPQARDDDAGVGQSRCGIVRLDPFRAEPVASCSREQPSSSRPSRSPVSPGPSLPRPRRRSSTCATIAGSRCSVQPVARTGNVIVVRETYKDKSEKRGSTNAIYAYDCEAGAVRYVDPSDARVMKDAEFYDGAYKTGAPAPLLGLQGPARPLAREAQARSTAPCARWPRRRSAP